MFHRLLRGVGDHVEMSVADTLIASVVLFDSEAGRAKRALLCSSDPANGVEYREQLGIIQIIEISNCPAGYHEDVARVIPADRNEGDYQWI